MFKLDLEKAEEPEIKLPTSNGSSKKQEHSKRSRKTSTSALLTSALLTKAFDCVDHNKLWKILKEMWILKMGRWEPSASWDICMHVKKQQLELDMEQQTGSKLEKKYVKAVYCHPAYLTYMQSTSCEMPGWMKHKLESKLPGEIPITSDMQISPLWLKVKRN